MGGTLGPLVQGSFLSLQRRVAVSAVFSIAFALGTLGTFSVVSFIGARLAPPAVLAAWRAPVTIVIMLLCVTLDLIALRRGGGCPLALRRQTPKSLARRHGMLMTMALWGADLGTAVSTYRVTAATWGAVTLLFWGWCSPWIGLCYAAGFTVPLMFLMWTGRLPRREAGHATASLQALLDLRAPAQRLSAVLMACGAALLAACRFG